MAAGPEPTEHERLAQRLDPERRGAGLWRRRDHAFNWQCRSAAFYRHRGQPAIDGYCCRPAINRDGRRAPDHRHRRSRTNLYLVTIRKPIHPISQCRANPIQSCFQSSGRPCFVVGQRLRRLEQRCQR